MKNKVTFQKVDFVYDVRYNDIYYQYIMSQTGDVGSNRLLDSSGESVEGELREKIIDWVRDNRSKMPKLKLWSRA